MQLFQEVKDIVADVTTPTGQRLVDTGKRSAKTHVVVKNGETIVIGGLLSDTDRRSESKVPLLGDIPFLGFLFRNQERRATKQNLLIFLTPTIINDERDMRMIYERRMKEREEFLRIYASRQLRKEEKKRKTVYDRFYGTGAKEEKKEQSKNEPPILFQPIDRPADVPPPADVKTTPQDAAPKEESTTAPATADETVATVESDAPIAGAATEGETVAP